MGWISGNQHSCSTPGIAVSLASSFFGMYAHGGFMRALSESGVEPSQIAGSSSGAFVAVLWASGVRGEEIESVLMAPGFRRCFWDWAAPLRVPGVLTSLLGSGALSGQNAIAFLRRYVGRRRIEDFSDPGLRIAATNLSRRESIMVEKGDAAAFAVASLAIPGLFRNQVIDGDRWCDGGVAQGMPILHWLDDPDVHTIVAHRIDHEPGTELVTEWPTLSSGFAESHLVITNRINELEMRIARERGKRVVEVVTETPHPKLLPHRMRPMLIERGRSSGFEAAMRVLQERERQPSSPVGGQRTAKSAGS